MGLEENDEDMKYKIRPVQLVMHNPNLFWVSPYDIQKSVEVLGGIPFVLSATIGAGVAVSYFKFSQVNARPNFYVNAMRTWGRFFFGLSIGGFIGYLRFGDRQRLHNAYTSYRIRKRYPESINITETNLWKHKDHKAHNDIYDFQ